MHKKGEILLITHELKGIFIGTLKEDFHPAENTYRVTVLEPLGSRVHKGDFEPCSANRCKVKSIRQEDIKSFKQNVEN